MIGNESVINVNYFNNIYKVLTNTNNSYITQSVLISKQKTDKAVLYVHTHTKLRRGHVKPLPR